jgi:glycosyltransferase involved in cell wall biosynthesis
MRRAVVDGYYGPYLEFADFAEILGRAPGPIRRAAEIGAVRGALLFAESIRRPAVAVVRLDRGWRTLLLGRAVLGRRRKLVVLQFLVLPPPERGWRRWAELAWRRIERWAVARAVRTGCVLTRWEAEEYAGRYGVEGGRFVCVPWPWRERREGAPPAYREDGGVIAAGRAFCDWRTLAAAAGGSAWPLTVVCAASDHPDVAALAWPPGTTVLSDVPSAEYLELLGGAAVAVFPLLDGQTSQAQIRLMHANDVGVPVVVSDVRGIEGYVVAGRTAVVVRAGDPAALRAEVDALLSAPGRRRELRAAALERSAAWTGHDYGRALEAVIRGERPRVPTG